jgi:beta-galactosidase
VRREVNVYSNCAEVELWLNGVSLGRKQRTLTSFPACGLSWQVSFAEGRNSLRAKGPGAAEDTMSLNYSFKGNDVADHLELSARPQETGAILITALAVDKNGNRALDYNKRVYFTTTGGGSEYAGTPSHSPIIEMANGRASWEIFPPAGHPVVVEVRNQDFKGAYVTISGRGSAR